MPDFEQLRRRAFEQRAEEYRTRMDPATGLLPSATVAFGAHSRAGGYSIRGAAEGAVCLAMTGDRELAWRLLGVVLDNQDTDQGSLTHGNFCWHTNWTTALDPNAVSFIAPCLCYLLKHRGDAMPGDLRRRLQRALALAVDGLNAHRATWEYTNIAVLNMASKLMIGDVLADSRARSLACWDWEEWRNHTARLGAIPEYNSLTYTAVQIHGLAMMLACAKPEKLICEARMAMRHLITAAVLDYHPGACLITGPQSRTSTHSRRYRGGTGMDTVLHFVLGTARPSGGCRMWLGAPIGPEDVLPHARDVRLPRTTKVSTHGHTRTNHLSRDYALGSSSGRAHWGGHSLPFLLAYRSSSDRCTIAFPEAHKNSADAHFSHQHQGSLLAGSLWLLARDAAHTRLADAWWEGTLSGLNTGRPDNLVVDRDFRPGFTIELGLRTAIRFFRSDGSEADPLSGGQGEPVLAIQTESVAVGLRFFGPPDTSPTLALMEEDDGEVILRVAGTREGMPVSTAETASFCGFLLHVVPRSEHLDGSAFARRFADVEVSVRQQGWGWRLRAPALDGSDLEADVRAAPPCLYSVDDVPITANRWVQSLGDGAS